MKQLKDLILGDLNLKVDIHNLAKQHVNECRNTVNLIVAKKLPYYGISTGFGKFKDVFIPHDQMVDLQKNLIISHASGVGESLKPHQVKLMMILRLNCLLRGFSGVSPSLIESLQEAINKDILPKVPCQGSVGASGDLAPLSHLALGLMGVGKIWNGKTYVEAGLFLREKKFEPITYLQKEGLAMNNGTQMMATINLETILRSNYLINAADLALGLSSFVLKANLQFLNYLKNTNKSKNIILKLIQENLRNQNNRFNPKSIFGSFSTHQEVRDTIEYCQKIVEREINSTSDNPLIDVETHSARSGGNFHGEYMAFVGDTLCIALQRLCIFSERRQERLVNSEIGDCDLPMFLTSKGGLLNGYMIPQYASAALVSENKVLAHPSCVDTIPTSANVEDHVSMGAFSARKGLQIIKNSEYVVAIELMCSAQGLEYIKEDLPPKIKSILEYIRKFVPNAMDQDIFMSQHIELMAKEIRNGKIDELMQQIDLF